MEVGRWMGMLVGAIGGAMLGAFLAGRPIIARSCGEVGGAIMIPQLLNPRNSAPAADGQVDDRADEVREEDDHDRYKFFHAVEPWVLQAIDERPDPDDCHQDR
jgi:hypothetical protein